MHTCCAPTIPTSECHGPESKPGKLESEHLVTIFDGKVKLPDTYFASVSVLPLEYGVGHPVPQHPVSDVRDFRDNTKIIKAMNCLTCHQPHSSAKPDLLVKDQENNKAFCATCHQGDIGAQVGKSGAK